MADSSVVSSRLHSRWAQLTIGIICMGAGRQPSICMDFIRSPNGSQKSLGRRGHPDRFFDIHRCRDMAGCPWRAGLVDKFGPRPVVLVGAVGAALGWVIDAHATTLPELYAAAVIAGIGAGCVYGTCVGNALKWFPDKRGLAAGLTAAGFGAGAAVTVIPIANMIQSSGYEHTFMFFGIFQGHLYLRAGRLVGQTQAAGQCRSPQALGVNQGGLYARANGQGAGVLGAVPDVCVRRCRRRSSQPLSSGPSPRNMVSPSCRWCSWV